MIKKIKTFLEDIRNKFIDLVTINPPRPIPIRVRTRDRRNNR